MKRSAAHLLRRSEAKLARREERRRRILDRLDAVRALLRDRFGVTQAVVFGSLEAPWFDEDSDVDLAIEGVDASELYELERRLLDLLEAPVDLFLMEELDQPFKDLIQREGRRLL